MQNLRPRGDEELPLTVLPVNLSRNSSPVDWLSDRCVS